MKDETINLGPVVAIAVGVAFLSIVAFVLGFTGAVDQAITRASSPAAPQVVEVFEAGVAQKLSIDELDYLGGRAQYDVVITSTGIAYDVDADVFLSAEPGRRYCFGKDAFGHILKNYGYAPCP